MLNSEQLKECAELLYKESREVLVSLEGSESAQELSRSYKQSAQLIMQKARALSTSRRLK